MINNFNSLKLFVLSFLNKEGKKLILFLHKCYFYILWDLFGLSKLRHKLCPQYDKIKNDRNGIPPVVKASLWVCGIYIGLFGIASQRYENRIDIIENRINNIQTQLSTPACKRALSRISRTQNMKCPVRPHLIKRGGFWFRLPIISLFCNTTYKDGIELLAEIAENWKDSLSGVNLLNAFLDSADLNNSNLNSASLQHALLRSAKLRNANLENANLLGANLSYANITIAKMSNSSLWGANLTKARLDTVDLKGAILNEAIFDSAYLVGTDMRNVNGVSPEQLCKAASLYGAKFSHTLFDSIKNTCPECLANKFNYEKNIFEIDNEVVNDINSLK
ncbi:MAG: pentapeptide repeat-containing protein [Chitinispirillaceae bacterium]|nr:pentapeptide repeat-containing protein [Chitinispirillaceae bacterium]